MALVNFRAFARHFFNDRHESTSEIHVTTLESEDEDHIEHESVIISNEEFQSGRVTDMLTIHSREQWEQLRATIDFAFDQIDANRRPENEE